MDIIADIVLIILIYFIIALIWQTAEQIFYGQITPRKIDDVVAIILAISIFFNLNG